MNDNSIHLIAFADDDADDREIFSAVCSDLDDNHRLLLFENGLELINYLQKPNVEIPEILFLDINMPVKNGFETLSDIRNNQDFNGTSIVMYSTSINRADVVKARALGANLYLQKPYDIQKLRSTVQKILNINWKKPYVHPEEEHFLITA